MLEILAKEDSLVKEDTPAKGNTEIKKDIRAKEDAYPETKSFATYQEIADDVTAKLLLLDRFGACHEIRFSAQDDDWTREYHERTGIPLAVYKERLEKLRTIPSTDKTAHPFGDRTTDEQLIA